MTEKTLEQRLIATLMYTSGEPFTFLDMHKQLSGAPFALRAMIAEMVDRGVLTETTTMRAGLPVKRYSKPVSQASWLPPPSHRAMHSCSAEWDRLGH